MPSGTEDVAETFNMGMSLVVRDAPQVREAVTVLGVLATDFQTGLDVTELVAANDVLGAAISALLIDTLTAADSVVVHDVVHLADAIAAAGLTQTAYSAIAELISALTASDSTISAAGVLVSDSFQFGDNLPAAEFGLVRRLAMLQEALTVTDQYSSTFTLVIEEAPIQFDSSQQLNKTLLAELIDYVDVYTLLKLPSEVAQGVAMNLEGLRPISEYSNYTYNSLTSFKGKFYGASDTGLYELEGDDDGGSPITAEIGSLMLDFGTSRQKRVRTAYLGYTATNQLVLRVKSISQGQLTEDWYEAREVESAEAPRANMVYVGQGLKSRYWQFELVNVDGGDFEIDLLEMYPIFLGRRV